MTVNSSTIGVILIPFEFSDNLSAENSKSSADFYIQRIQLLECMVIKSATKFIRIGVTPPPFSENSSFFPLKIT